MKFESRQQYVHATDAAWTKLWTVVDELSERQLTRRKRLTDNGPARSPTDALAHLYAWHRLLLGWCRSESPDLPAPGFSWRDTRALNEVLHRRHARDEYRSVRRRLRLSHTRIAKLVSELTDRELLESGAFSWTGRLPLISYIAPNTVSHYKWATRRIRALVRTG